MGNEDRVMKVKRFTMQNVKAVNCFDYEFPDSGMTAFGGKNNQGKTSILNGIQYAAGGEAYRPTNYKKDGAAGDPVLRLEFTNGIVAQRVGESADLKVWDENGRLQNQSLLNQYITKFALDLPKFLNGTDKDRCEILLKALGVQKEVEAIEERIDVEFADRTVIGRLRDQKKKAGKEMPFYEGVPSAEISPADVMARMQEVNIRNAKIEAAKQELEKNNAELVRLVETGEKIDAALARMDGETQSLIKKVDDDLVGKVDAIEQQIRQLEQQRESAKEFARSHKEQIRKSADENKAALSKQKEVNDKAVDDLSDKIAKAETDNLTLEDTSSFQSELKAIEDTNIKVRENIAREKVLEDAKEQARKYDEKTVIIEDLRKQKDALLEGAGLPYPGLSVENKVVTLNGKAWDCMSESMKIRVGCAIVMRINPACRFMLVDKLEQLDEDSRKELTQFAKDHDILIIGTIVSSDPEDCSIIIKNGYIEGMEDHMVEIPKITRRKAVKKPATAGESETTGESDGGVSVAEEPVSGDDVLGSALAGQETDAMRKAKELLARKRAAAQTTGDSL